MRSMIAGFSANNAGFWDRLIAFAEGRYEPTDVLRADRPLATHAWLRWVNDDGDSWGIEAIPPRVHVFRPADKAGQTIREYVVPVTPAAARAAWDIVQDLDGMPYNGVGVLATGLLLALHLPDVFERVEGAALFCSQLVGDVLARVGYDPTPGFRHSNLSPAHLEVAIGALEWAPLTPAAAVVEDRAAHGAA